MSTVDMFLKIPEIEGESQDSRHHGELDLLTYSGGVDRSISIAAATGNPGLSTWGEAKFSMWVDKAYPKLFLACNTGSRLEKAVLTVRKAGKEQQEFLKVTFSEVLVSKCELAPEDHPVPIVRFAFTFAKIEEEYRMQKADGSLSGPIKFSYSIPTAS